MPYDPRIHHRRSIRLKGYDYTQPGAYYVTIDTQDHLCLFGEVSDARMYLNRYGKIADDEWKRCSVVRPNVQPGPYVVMPNHIHAILSIIADPMGNASPQRADQTATPARPKGPLSGSLGAILGQFKSNTSRRINAIRNTPGIQVWQRNYYEHIIRDEEEMNGICLYIAENPRQWELEQLRQARGKPTG